MPFSIERCGYVNDYYITIEIKNLVEQSQKAIADFQEKGQSLLAKEGLETAISQVKERIKALKNDYTAMMKILSLCDGVIFALGLETGELKTMAASVKKEIEAKKQEIAQQGQRAAAVSKSAGSDNDEEQINTRQYGKKQLNFKRDINYIMKEYADALKAIEVSENNRICLAGMLSDLEMSQATIMNAGE